MISNSKKKTRYLDRRSYFNSPFPPPGFCKGDCVYGVAAKTNPKAEKLKKPSSRLIEI